MENKTNPHTEQHTMLAAVFAFLKQKFCKHEFKGKDMEKRDESGIVRWPCHKCKKVFSAEYGLKILENGKCIGEWS
jgi:transposase-like protein